MAEPAFSAALEDDGTVAMPPSALGPEAVGSAWPSTILDPAVAELCVPLSIADPCGPDLDLTNDSDYLNFFAQTEGLLPSSFFSSDDGKPFDRASIDLARQIEVISPLWERSRDLRLLVIRARLMILDRNLGGFAVSVAAMAEWLEHYWDDLHPRAAGGDLGGRVAALGSLELPTVVFPLQYAPLCEGRRIGAITYRAWMIASGDVKPRAGEQKHPSTALTEAVADAPPEVLTATRKHVDLLRTSLARIRDNFTKRGFSAGLESLPALVDKIQGFVDPRAALHEESPTAEDDDVSATAKESTAPGALGGAPTSLAEAQHALAAIAAYYSRSEPSSPTLPLIRQAHQLIGKSFFEVMSILVPSQMDKAAFQIGVEQFFELPVGKLSKLSEAAPPSPDGAEEAKLTAPAEDSGSIQYHIKSRAQAIALLDQVQRFFRHAEPSSPVPMLCDRARALAERDFMGVLREVLPKSSLKNFGGDK
jgi:type VI secretion system protein ImpA